MYSLKRILVVEDSARDAELILEALAANNLANEVVRVQNGVEALDYLYRRGPFEGRASGQPAVILLDLKMPKVDGSEVLRQIKGDPQLKVIPVIIMTSSREEIDLHRSYELGANAYVVKPLTFPDFVAAVTHLGVFWAIVNETPPGSVPRAPGGEAK